MFVKWVERLSEIYIKQTSVYKNFRFFSLWNYSPPLTQGCASMQGAAHYDSNSGGVVNIKGSILRW